jgi:hypothetical protein
MIKTYMLATLVALAAIVANTGSASAQTLYTPVSDCKWDEPQGSRQWGYATNTSTSSTLKVWCGFEKFSGTRILNIDYTVWNGALLCHAYVRSWGGSLLWIESKANLFGSPNGVATFTIPSTLVGYGSIMCELPTVGSSGSPSLRGYNVSAPQ